MTAPILPADFDNAAFRRELRRVAGDINRALEPFERRAFHRAFAVASAEFFTMAGPLIALAVAIV